MNTQHTPELFERADAQVSAYARAPIRYVIARRNAALIQAANPLLSSAQVAYWNRIADGCGAITKAAASAGGKSANSGDAA